MGRLARSRGSRGGHGSARREMGTWMDGWSEWGMDVAVVYVFLLSLATCRLYTKKRGKYCFSSLGSGSRNDVNKRIF